MEIIDFPEKLSISVGVLMSGIITTATTIFFVAKIMNRIENRLTSIESRLGQFTDRKDLMIFFWKLGQKNPTLIIPEFSHDDDESK